MVLNLKPSSTNYKLRTINFYFLAAWTAAMNFLAVAVISSAVLPPPVRAPPAPTATQPALIQSPAFSTLTPPVGIAEPAAGGRGWP